MDLKTFLLQNVDATTFYKSEIEGWEEGKNALCPFHVDTDPSLGLEPKKDGAFYCYTCGAKGTSWIGYYAKREGLDDNFGEALKQLYAKYVRPIVPSTEILEWHETLLDTPSAMEWLNLVRGITETSVRRFKLGFDGRRITIPVFTPWGFAVNVRRYQAKAKKGTPKIVSYGEGYGSNYIFPSNLHKEEKTYIFEGEFDTILANQLGLNAVTATTGAKSGYKDIVEFIGGLQTVICYDVNDKSAAGHDASVELAKLLQESNSMVTRVDLPIDDKGGDFTDYIMGHSFTVSDFHELVSETEPETSFVVESVYSAPVKVPLELSDKPEYFGKRIEVSGHVVGKDTCPYDIPTKVTLECTTKPDKPCEFCAGNGSFLGSVTLNPRDPEALGYTGLSEEQRDRRLKKRARCGGRCSVDVTIEQVETIEDVTIVPELDTERANNNYVLRKAYVLGSGLISNSTYLFTGQQTPDPKTQHVTYLFDENEPAYDSIESFTLTEEVSNTLRTFETSNIPEVQDERYRIYANSITKIYGRRDLHEAVDLVYFSPLTFKFNGRTIKKGWLEILIVGDTRTGKGYVAEGLQKYYGLGEVASAENCSFAGLVGGMQQVGAGRSWSITWGIIPRNDRRLVVLDEVSALSLDDVARMSRIRSEGVAEIVKIHAERTLARTRLIWIGNPRDERQMSRHEYGVESIKKLIGKSEDIARFDYAIVAAHNDVAGELINTLRTEELHSEEYENERKRNKNLVLWVWSRRADQIQFTEEATKTILRVVPFFAKQYSSNIPLVQSENFGEKLAKISAAVAGRTHSCDSTGAILVVTASCVKYAAEFLQRLYTAKNMAYDTYSDLDRITENMSDVTETASYFEQYGDRVPHIIEMMMMKKLFKHSDIQQIFDADYVTAREITGDLVRQRVLKPKGGHYVKTSDAIQWFKSKYHQVNRQVSNPR